MKSREEYDAMYKRSIDDPVGFWSDIAKQFHWCALHSRSMFCVRTRGPVRQLGRAQRIPIARPRAQRTAWCQLPAAGAAPRAGCRVLPIARTHCP